MSKTEPKPTKTYFSQRYSLILLNWKLPLALIVGTVYSVAEITIAIAANPQLEAIARQVTVRIAGENNSGSGVIVERSNKTYYILTNAHVVNKLSKYTVITPDGQTHPVSNIAKLPNLDLALLSIKSDRSYPVVEIGSTDNLAIGQQLYVAGFPRSGGSLRQFIFTGTEGMLTETGTKLPLGYSLTYTNLARAGMSGGPVLDRQGKLIGINGVIRMPGNTEQVVASGIKIELFLNWRSSLGIFTDSEPNSPSPSTTTKVEPRYSYRLVRTIGDRESQINAVAINPVSGAIALVHSNGKITLWDANTGSLMKSWQGHDSAIQAIAISPDGNVLASGDEQGVIKLWQIANSQLLNTLTGHQATVASLVFSADGMTIASGSWDKTVKVWETKGNLQHSLTGHSQLVSSVAISPDGKTLISGSQDTTIRLWNLATGKLINTLNGHALSVLSLAISPDGKTLASGSGEGKIAVWDLTTKKLTYALQGHTDGVWSLAIASDNQTLFSSSWDSTIKIWDLATHKLQNTLLAHDGYV
ncbi:MAG TPA: trypsin-like peptidase domain-containing protein, partial [Xenococcaceae cyanobacterium]